jgi:hypothetical protein
LIRFPGSSNFNLSFLGVQEVFNHYAIFQSSDNLDILAFDLRIKQFVSVYGSSTLSAWGEIGEGAYLWLTDAATYQAVLLHENPPIFNTHTTPTCDFEDENANAWVCANSDTCKNTTFLDIVANIYLYASVASI